MISRMSQGDIFFEILIAATVFLTAINEGGPWASDCVWHEEEEGGRREGPLAKNQPEPVTGPWVYTEAVYLFCMNINIHVFINANQSIKNLS